MSKIMLDDMLPPLLLDPSGMTTFLLLISRTQHELVAGQWCLPDRAESHVDHASKGAAPFIDISGLPLLLLVL
jgi:hypothetical protein